MQQASEHSPTRYSSQLSEILDLAEEWGKAAGEDRSPSFTGLGVGLYRKNEWFRTQCNMLAINEPTVEKRPRREQITGPTQSVRRILETAERFHEQVASDGPLDCHHLIAAILLDPRDHLPQLKAWGFNIDIWRERFFTHVQSIAPKEEARGWEKLASSYEIRPRNVGKRYRKTDLIDGAIKLGEKSFSEISPSKNDSDCFLRSDGLAIAFAEFGYQVASQGANSGAFLYHEFVHRAGNDDPAIMQRLRTWWAEREISPTAGTADYYAAFDRAEAISKELGNENGMICGRHLLASLLTLPPPSRFQRMLAEIKLKVAEVRRRFLQLMNDSGEVDPKKEAWEKILAVA